MVTTDNVPTGDVTIFILASQSIGSGSLVDTNGLLMLSSSSESNIARQSSSANLHSFGDAGMFVPAVNGTFYTIRYRVNGSNRFLSVNNGTEDTDTYTPAGTPSVFHILNNSGGTNPGNKSIAEILIYTRSLTTDEINDLELYFKEKYEHYSDVPEEIVQDGLWAHYDANLGVDDSSGFIWSDQSGNNNHLFDAGSTPPDVLDAVDSGLPVALPVVSSYGVNACRLETGAYFPNLQNGGAVFMVAAQSALVGAKSDSLGPFLSSYNQTSGVDNFHIRKNNSSTTSGGLTYFALNANIREGSQATSADLLLDDMFYTMALIVDGVGNFKFRVNGVEQWSTAGTSGTSVAFTTQKLSMFATNYGTYANKHMAECAIYDEVLTLDEILANELFLKTKFHHYV